MALNDYKLNYTKSWRNPSDFATYENSEAQVRDDMQILFDEMRNAFNAFLDALDSTELPFDPTAEINSSTVQAAIENVQGQIAGIQLGQITDGSLTTPKYKDKSVTLAKLGDDVTPAGIGAAAAVHTHDDRYYTEAETDAKLSDKQTKTSLLTTMGDPVADGDSFPMYDVSVTEAKKLTWLALKAAMKAYFDTIYGVVLESHAARHAAGGGDPITVTAGNIAPNAVETSGLHDSAVTEPKIAAEAVSKKFNATISNSWKSKYTSTKTVSGLVSGEAVTATSGSLDLRAVASATNTLGLTLLGTKPGDTISVKLVVNGARAGWNVEDISAGTYSTTISVAATDWAGSTTPYLQEVAVPGLLASDNPIVDIAPSDTFTTAEAQLNAWAVIYRMVAGNGVLTVYAMEPADTAVPVHIQCVRK